MVTIEDILRLQIKLMPGFNLKEIILRCNENLKVYTLSEILDYGCKYRITHYEVYINNLENNLEFEGKKKIPAAYKLPIGYQVYRPPNLEMTLM